MRCTIKFKGVSYVKYMSFGLMGEPLTKVQRTDSGSVAGSYALAYEYGDADHPTAPSQIGHERYTYDANGNPTLVEDDSLNTERRMAWDEENRLMALSDNGKTSRYTYNAAGERIVKSHGYLEGVYVNGAPQGLTFHETEDYTIYPAPILSVTRQRFTKHYFIGDRRVASKIGAGIFQNAYGHGANVVTAGQKDYQMRMMQIEKQREDYYRKLGTPPGVPTMKGATAEPENTHEGYNTIIKELGDHSVPDGWIQRPKRNAVPGTPPGPPVQWDKAEDPDDVQPGYGYVPADTTHEDIFYYHTDHLGSTSYITDAKANIAQFDAYLPYGELLVDEHSSTEEMPYKFNGKELDEETGLYYYGARYMNPRTSLWYGVDPMAEKYPEIGGYIYCHNNPIILADPTGMDDIFDEKGNFIKDTGKGSMVLIQQGGQLNKLSSFDYSEGKDANRNMLKGVASYYLAQNDKHPFDINISNTASTNPAGAVFSYDTKKGNYSVELNNGRVGENLDNKYIFLNITYHESRHRYFPETRGDTIGEVRTIIMQALDKSWDNVPEDFQHSQAGYAQQKINEAKLSASERAEYVNRLNEVFSGIAKFSVNGKTVNLELFKARIKFEAVGHKMKKKQDKK